MKISKGLVEQEISAEQGTEQSAVGDEKAPRCRLYFRERADDATAGT
jgi:hypothetical protein